MQKDLIPEGLWSTEDTARYLDVPLGTLYQWRHRGEGPVGHRVGRFVRYRREDVDAWLAGRRDDRAQVAG